MILYLIATIFAFAGFIFWFMNAAGTGTDTKSWAKLCLILSGVLITVKLYLENQDAVQGFINF